MSYGCGGKSRSDGADLAGAAGGSSAGTTSNGSAGAPGRPPRLCQATLHAQGRAPVELDCEQGIHALGGGLYRLELTSLPGDVVVVTFPTLETGFFASPACVTGSVALSGDSTYLADSVVPDTVAVLRVESSSDVLTGQLEGIFADYVADNGTGQPGPVFITPRVELTSIPITRRELDCDCGPARSYDDHCELPTCDSGSCYFASCPAGAAACGAP